MLTCGLRHRLGFTHWFKFGTSERDKRPLASTGSRRLKWVFIFKFGKAKTAPVQPAPATF